MIFDVIKKNFKRKQMVDLQVLLTIANKSLKDFIKLFIDI